MLPNFDHISRSYGAGFNAGYKAGRIDQETSTGHVQAQFYDLTPHDLDTIAMGIALVVLHAADIQTIDATMDTQQKLGVAEKVLGWLHLTSTVGVQLCSDITLHETALNPWLNPYERERGARIAENQAIDNAHDLADLDGQMEAYDEVPF